MGIWVKLECERTHRRTSPRFKVFEPAAIECDGARQRAHILDVSVGGARLHCAETPPVGSYLALSVGDVIMRARIVWAREQRFGVEFQSPLPPVYLRSIVEGTASRE